MSVKKGDHKNCNLSSRHAHGTQIYEKERYRAFDPLLSYLESLDAVEVVIAALLLPGKVQLVHLHRPVVRGDHHRLVGQELGLHDGVVHLLRRERLDLGRRGLGGQVEPEGARPVTPRQGRGGQEEMTR